MTLPPAAALFCPKRVGSGWKRHCVTKSRAGMKAARSATSWSWRVEAWARMEGSLLKVRVNQMSLNAVS
jgi:hypothetical protein